MSIESEAHQQTKDHLNQLIDEERAEKYRLITALEAANEEIAEKEDTIMRSMMWSRQDGGIVLTGIPTTDHYVVSLNGYQGEIKQDGGIGALPSAPTGNGMPDAAQLRLYAEFILALAEASETVKADQKEDK